MRATLPDGRTVSFGFTYTKAADHPSRITECYIRHHAGPDDKEGTKIGGGVTKLNPADSDCKETARKYALARAMGLRWVGGGGVGWDASASTFSQEARAALWKAYLNRPRAAKKE